jgi:2'-5' RNA ligase
VSAKNNFSDNGERYYYAFLTEERNAGHESKHTPQHITLIPPFNAKKEDVLAVAKETAADFNPFEIETGEHTMFGPEKNIPVIEIKPNQILHAIHLALLARLEARDIIIKEGKFIGDDYVPHIALKKFHPRLEETRPILVDHIAVMHKFKNIKTVIVKNTLGINDEAAAR